jgi:cytochrome P450
MNRERRFPLGTTVGIEQLAGDPHPLLHRLRAREPVSWLPALDGWLVTRYDLCVAAMRDARTYTVDDPRFSTARVIGPSMLSLDGPEHARHREPFLAPFRPRAVSERFAAATAAEAERLLDGFAAAGAGDLSASLAGPLAAAMATRAVGLDPRETGSVRARYQEIVAAVTAITASGTAPDSGREAYAALAERIRAPAPGSLLGQAADRSGLDCDQIIANGAVLLFGGIETTEGMIANALLHVLAHDRVLAAVRDRPQECSEAIEESLRLEPAASVVDRYCTADTELGGITLKRGELVRISIAGANRDPAVFADPDRFELHRPDRRHLAFAQGPHVCIGVHLARLEARTALASVLQRLPGLRLDPSRPAEVGGLVFRKPRQLHAIWDT